MEQIIAMKDEWLEKLGKMLAPGELVIFAIPCGMMRTEPGRLHRAHERDYMIVTNRRIISLKGQFFRDGSGFTAYPKKMCDGARLNKFATGTTIRVFLNDGPEGRVGTTLEFPNCKRAHAEIIVEELQKKTEQATRHCPSCLTVLQRDFTFCPGCGASLKKICPRCGKTLSQAGSNCPYCGGRAGS